MAFDAFFLSAVMDEIQSRTADARVDKIHQPNRDTIAMVKATYQAKFVDKMLPLLTEEELAYYRRGKNSHVHAVPKSATPAEYAKATGLEAMFGYLFLSGQKDRANEIFNIVMENINGL